MNSYLWRWLRNLGHWPTSGGIRRQGTHPHITGVLYSSSFQQWVNCAQRVLSYIRECLYFWTTSRDLKSGTETNLKPTLDSSGSEKEEEKSCY